MSKNFLTYDQQIFNLENEKNLQIDDEVYAKEILRQTGYYSLIDGYKDVFKNPTTKKFRDGTKFEDIVALYYFDEALRQLLLRFLIKIENEIKSQVSYYFVEKHGIEQTEYLKTSNYNFYGRRNQQDIEYLIRVLRKYVEKSTGYGYINHYRINHGNIPLWVLTKALTFGNISKIYMLLSQDLQIKISKNYLFINEQQLSSILSLLVKFRNVCAHGERLFTYRTIKSIPDFPAHQKLGITKKGKQYINGKNDLFAVVISLKYILNDAVFQKFIEELQAIIGAYIEDKARIPQEVLFRAMGFPENWNKITQ